MEANDKGDGLNLNGQMDLFSAIQLSEQNSNEGKPSVIRIGKVNGQVSTERHEPKSQSQQMEVEKLKVITDNEDFVAPELKGDRKDDESIFQSGTATELREIVSNEPPVKNLIAPLIREKEATILFAGTGLGKSILAMQIAIAITRGEHLFFSDDFRLENECEAQKVLYFDFELSNQQIVKRWGKEEINDNLIISKLKRGKAILETNPFNIFQLLKNEADRNNCKVIIIDNISKIGNKLEETENAIKFMDALWALAKDEGYSILVIAHTPKRNRQQPITIDSLAGSAKIAALCDAIFAINEVNDEEGDKKYIIQLKTRDGEAEYGKNNVICTKIGVDPVTNQVKHFFQELMTEMEALTGVKPIDSKYQVKKEASIAYLLSGSYSVAAERTKTAKSTIENRDKSYRRNYPNEFKILEGMSKKELSNELISLKSNED